MKRVLITGANRGIGLELSRQYAARGERVFAGCRYPEKSSGLEEIARQYPGRVTVLPLDVTDAQGIEDCAGMVQAETDGLDLLINNAAINLGDEALSAVKAEALLQTLQVNAVGAVLVAQKFVSLLKMGVDPKLVNISSEAGSISHMQGFRGYGYYGSKSAMNMYTRCLSLDPEMGGVIVIAMHPGWVRTDMGGMNAHLSPHESALGIIKVTDGLTPEENGKFYTWEGKEYPW
jgi:NAD(P)-dependent dehydrogenase (short-subunit alcohol dehydrogenase family)